MSNWKNLLFSCWLDNDLRIPEGGICQRCDRVTKRPDVMLVLAQRLQVYVDEDGRTVNKGVRFCECPLENEVRPRYAE